MQKTLTEKRENGKKLIADLRMAIEARDPDPLEKAIDAFKAAGLTQVARLNVRARVRLFVS